MSKKTELNIKALEDLEKLLRKKIPKVRVGIMGDKDSRSGLGESNATVGAFHEFGTEHIPQRSFLRMPLTEKMNDAIESSGLLNKKTLNKVLQEKSLKQIAEMLGVMAEGIVLEAFDTGGFGKWLPWKNSNYKNNANQLLVDTQQLRDSITYVVDDED